MPARRPARRAAHFPNVFAFDFLVSGTDTLTVVTRRTMSATTLSLFAPNWLLLGGQGAGADESRARRVDDVEQNARPARSHRSSASSCSVLRSSSTNSALPAVCQPRANGAVNSCGERGRGIRASPSHRNRGRLEGLLLLGAHALNHVLGLALRLLHPLCARCGPRLRRSGGGRERARRASLPRT